MPAWNEKQGGVTSAGGNEIEIKDKRGNESGYQTRCGARGRVLTDARRNMRSALLVAPGASVASSTGYTVFAGTLAGALVTGLSRSADRMAVARCNATKRAG